MLSLTVGLTHADGPSCCLPLPQHPCRARLCGYASHPGRRAHQSCLVLSVDSGSATACKQTKASAVEIAQLAGAGAEIAEVASTCFVITLVVRHSPMCTWVIVANEFRLTQRRLVVATILALCILRGLQSASCCCEWRRACRATRSKRKYYAKDVRSMNQDSTRQAVAGSHHPLPTALRSDRLLMPPHYCAEPMLSAIVRR